MRLTGDEAKEALDIIEEVKRKTDRKVAGEEAFQQLLLWGIIWFVFPMWVFLKPQPYWVPLLLFPFGGVITTIIARSKRHAVNNPSNPKGAVLWWVLFMVIGLLAFIVQPETMEQCYSFGCISAMLVFMVIGIYSDLFFLYLGVAVTSFVLLGLYVFTPLFWPWMAFFGGGSLLIAAVYLKYFRK